MIFIKVMLIFVIMNLVKINYFSAQILVLLNQEWDMAFIVNAQLM